MPSKTILFSQFVDYFLDNDTQKSKQYDEDKEGDDDYEFIVVEYKSNDVKDLPYMCNMLWRVADGTWKKIRYNGSSSFAMWWCSNEDGIDESETDVCNTCNCDFDTSELIICSGCHDTICDNCSNDNPYSFITDKLGITEYYCESCKESSKEKG